MKNPYTITVKDGNPYRWNTSHKVDLADYIEFKPLTIPTPVIDGENWYEKMMKDYTLIRTFDHGYMIHKDHYRPLIISACLDSTDSYKRIAKWLKSNDIDLFKEVNKIKFRQCLSI